VGVRRTYIEKRAGTKPGTDETQDIYELSPLSSPYSFRDFRIVTLRNPQGAFEEGSISNWTDAVLTRTQQLTPVAGRKLRARHVNGTKTSTAELAYDAPFASRTWASRQLLALRPGSANTVRLASAVQNEDGDPIVQYDIYKARTDGVLVMTQSASGAEGAEYEQLRGSPEIRLNPQGLVKQRVSSDSTAELVYSWGEVPKEAGVSLAQVR
jgi:hypothetical protein